MLSNEFEPIKSLTQKVIDELIIHSTTTSLRRSVSVNCTITKVEGDVNVPTLYYVSSLDKSMKLHALVADINRYLLFNGFNSIPVIPEQDPESPKEEPVEPLFIRSTISWDGITGEPADGDWDEPTITGEHNNELRFNGKIAWYDVDDIDSEMGNRVGVIITPDPQMISTYSDASVYYHTTELTLPLSEVCFSVSDEPQSITYYPVVSEPGEEHVVTIYWDKANGIMESFPVIISQESTLEIK